MALQGHATEKQKDYLLSLGYTGDVELLSKAQASLIIDKLVEQRDERERRRSKPTRGSYLVPTTLGCLVVLIAPFAFAWLFGALPWQNAAPEHVVVPPAEPTLPAEAPPQVSPVPNVPSEPPPTTEAPATPVEPVPEPTPADPVPEPMPVDPRVHTFVDVSGRFRITARLKSVANGVATIVKEDGTEVKVPIDKLSEESAQWVRDFIATPKSSETP